MDENKYSVYMHTVPNGKVYIGITGQKPTKRWLAGKGYQKQDYFYNAILKYGWGNIKHEILYEHLSKDEAETKEAELINRYKANNRKFGYNIENGGHLHKVSDSTREKMRQNTLGKKHTPETCEKLRELERQRWLDEEYRNNQIQKRKGRTPHNKGKTTPIETRLKQRERKLGKHTGADHWASKRVINLDTGAVYESIGMLAKSLGVANGSHIVSVCKGRRAKAYGYRWAYYEGGDTNVS